MSDLVHVAAIGYKLRHAKINITGDKRPNSVFTGKRAWLEFGQERAFEITCADEITFHFARADRHRLQTPYAIVANTAFHNPNHTQLAGVCALKPIVNS